MISRRSFFRFIIAAGLFFLFSECPPLTMPGLFALLRIASGDEKNEEEKEEDVKEE